MTPFQHRIVYALRGFPGGSANEAELAGVLFPVDKYPRAWRSPSRGGPPGLQMVLSRGISQLARKGAVAHRLNGPGPGNRHVTLLLTIP